MSALMIPTAAGRLFYRAPDETLMAAAVRTAGGASSSGQIYMAIH